jgi:hypothetical protein
MTDDVIFPQQVLFCELAPLQTCKLKRFPDFGLPDTFRHFNYTFSFKSRLFIAEVNDHASAGENEKESGFP